MDIRQEDNGGSSEKKTSIWLFFLLLIAVVMLASFAYMKSKGLDLSDIKSSLAEMFGDQAQTASSEETVEFNYDSKQHPVFCTYKEYIIIGTTEGIKAFNSKGEVAWSVTAPVGKAMLKSSEDKLLLADLGGKDVYIFNKDKLEWQQSFEGNIINADVSRSGYVTIVHEMAGYKGMVRVFDAKGQMMLSRYIASNFVVSSMVSPSGGQLVINSIDASGAKANPYLQFFDLKKQLEEPSKEPDAAGIPVQDEILAYVSFLGDDALYAVGDTSLIYYDKEREQKWIRKFHEIYSACVSAEKYAVVASKGGSIDGPADGSGPQVQVFNAKNNIVGTFPVDTSVKSVVAHADLIGVNTGREAFFIDTEGKLKARYTAKADIEKIYFINENTVAIITKTSITVFHI